LLQHHIQSREGRNNQAIKPASNPIFPILHDKIPFFQFSSAAEFILYKLKELGKVDEADIVDIANEFCSLDYDQNGALKISSFHVPQATDLPA
jgi:hypothetical protein